MQLIHEELIHHMEKEKQKYSMKSWGKYISQQEFTHPSLHVGSLNLY
jgi:hypothetical protein